ncbi:MAG TPA: TetR/AcrR family transcriptional regulator [Mycobacteriales bacterium]|jgi:AcrR family transcriptional regulator|nr:TetR/AcrR family transcriptional regulator [Mycobacteriales bacterium]
MNETPPGLPPAIVQLWGLSAPARRGGPKPALSLERIVAAAIELADAGGLAALSMSRLAEKLGFTTMSLYRYVASKDDLLVLCLDATLAAAPDLDPESGWRVQLEGWAGALRVRYQQHGWMLDVPISGLPAGPNQLVWFERGLRALAGTTLEAQERASTVLLLSTYVRGQVQMVADLVRAAVPESGPPVDWAAVVRQVADPERFPEVAKLVSGGVFDDEFDEFPDDEFAFGLRRILDGVEVLHRSRVSG